MKILHILSLAKSEMQSTHTVYIKNSLLMRFGIVIANIRKRIIKEEFDMSKIIGIDLGTTNSVVAVVEGSEPCSNSKRAGSTHNTVSLRIYGR